MAGGNPKPRRPVYVSPTLVCEFEMNWAGIRRIAVGRELRFAVQDLARRARVYAQGISPVSDERHRHYQQSFSVQLTHHTVRGLRRRAARLVNDAPHAFYVEVGGRNHDGFRVMRKTLQHLQRAGGNGFLGMPAVGRTERWQRIHATPDQFRSSRSYIPARGVR